MAYSILMLDVYDEKMVNKIELGANSLCSKLNARYQCALNNDVLITMCQDFFEALAIVVKYRMLILPGNHNVETDPLKIVWQMEQRWLQKCHPHSILKRIATVVLSDANPGGPMDISTLICAIMGQTESSCIRWTKWDKYIRQDMHVLRGYITNLLRSCLAIAKKRGFVDDDTPMDTLCTALQVAGDEPVVGAITARLQTFLAETIIEC